HRPAGELRGPPERARPDAGADLSQGDLRGSPGLRGRHADRSGWSGAEVPLRPGDMERLVVRGRAEEALRGAGAAALAVAGARRRNPSQNSTPIPTLAL